MYKFRQVCGIADSGLNELSCFFFDGPPLSFSSSAYTTPAFSTNHSSLISSALLPPTPKPQSMLTNRSGIVEPLRRKVIQYVAYADTVDEMDGHGTHVSGSVAGKSLGDFQEMDGIVRIYSYSTCKPHLTEYYCYSHLTFSTSQYFNRLYHNHIHHHI
jgi:hypothetical protein